MTRYDLYHIPDSGPRDCDWGAEESIAGDYVRYDDAMEEINRLRAVIYCLAGDVEDLAKSARKEV